MVAFPVYDPLGASLGIVSATLIPKAPAEIGHVMLVSEPQRGNSLLRMVTMLYLNSTLMVPFAT